MPQRHRVHQAITRRLASTTGAVDLASVLVGVLILGIVSGIVLAATQFAVPWAQDQGAQQNLNNIRVGEAAAYLNGNQYLGEKDLIAGKYYSGKALADIDASGDCYIAATLSPTGNVYWTQNGDDTIHKWVTGDTSTCSDVKRLHDRLLGILPVNNLTLSYPTAAFDPSATGQTFGPTVTGDSGNYTYKIDKDISATGIAFDTNTGIFTGPSTAWNMPFDSVTTFNLTSCGIVSGAVYCWGLSNGTGGGGSATADVKVPTRIGGLTGLTATSVSVGQSVSCAVADGQAYCWGDGQASGGADTTRNGAAKLVQGLSGKTVTAVAVGYAFTCVIADANPYCWGTDSYSSSPAGQLGDAGVGGVKTTPTAVPLGSVIPANSSTMIAAGAAHACVIAGGAPYCWGLNSNGQLGNGSTGAATAPVPAKNDGALAGKTITAIDLGDMTSCVVASGAAYCWGQNSNGQLGDGSVTAPTAPPDASVPQAVYAGGALNGKTVTAISAAKQNTCVVASGAPYCWGEDSYSQVSNTSPNFGNNLTTKSSIPTLGVVAGSGLAGKTITGVSVGWQYVCWVADQSVACDGRDTNYSLGDGGTATQKLAATIAKTGANNGLPVTVKVTVAEKTDSTVYKDLSLQLRVAVK